MKEIYFKQQAFRPELAKILWFLKLICILTQCSCTLHSPLYLTPGENFCLFLVSKFTAQFGTRLCCTFPREDVTTLEIIFKLHYTTIYICSKNLQHQFTWIEAAYRHRGVKLLSMEPKVSQMAHLGITNSVVVRLGSVCHFESTNSHQMLQYTESHLFSLRHRCSLFPSLLRLLGTGSITLSFFSTFSILKAWSLESHQPSPRDCGRVDEQLMINSVCKACLLLLSTNTLKAS